MSFYSISPAEFGNVIHSDVICHSTAFVKVILRMWFVELTGITCLLDLRKLNDLCGKIFRNLSFVELTSNNLTQLSRDNTWMQVLFA
jgi:hypothetical protein